MTNFLGVKFSITNHSFLFTSLNAHLHYMSKSPNHYSESLTLSSSCCSETTFNRLCILKLPRIPHWAQTIARSTRARLARLEGSLFVCVLTCTLCALNERPRRCCTAKALSWKRGRREWRQTANKLINKHYEENITFIKLQFNTVYTYCKPERRRAVSHYGNGCKQKTKFCQLWSNTNREDKVYNLIFNQ